MLENKLFITKEDVVEALEEENTIIGDSLTSESNKEDLKSIQKEVAIFQKM